MSGRSPLYRLIDFFEEKDTELLLGEAIPADRFTDHNVGRAFEITFGQWVRRKTKKPTSFMMSTKFVSVLVIKNGRNRQLARPLKPVQHEYLRALVFPLKTLSRHKMTQKINQISVQRGAECTIIIEKFIKKALDTQQMLLV